MVLVYELSSQQLRILSVYEQTPRTTNRIMNKTLPANADVAVSRQRLQDH